jgi:hypothetical protein
VNRGARTVRRLQMVATLVVDRFLVSPPVGLGPKQRPLSRRRTEKQEQLLVRLYAPGMCRNIQQLRGADPPATAEEIQDAALQFVRKVSGYRQPSQANRATFERAVDDVTTATARLLDELVVGSTSAPVVPLQRRRADADRDG